MEKQQNGQKEDMKGSWWLRNMIALIITVAVIGMTITIGIYYLNSSQKEGLDFIGKSLLPLWGTWIGTVLAFYFGKANFEAATKSYQDVIKTLTPEEKIAKLAVKDAMIPFSQIEYLDYDTEKDKYISDILNYERFKKYNRYAIFDQKKVLKFIIHRSTFYQFIAQKVEENKSNDEIKKLTLQNIIDNSNADIKNMLYKGYNFIAIKASLLDAKIAMDAIPECQDVFVTDTGRTSEPVLGLITNNVILEKAKV
ncbi:MAG TPA: hypothetical protein VIH57_09910 [Bacteroidales bacterium]